MTSITTTEQMRADAHELMERALCALDRAGESMAAIHLDLAIETLGQRSAGGRAAMLGGTAFHQHDTMKRARRIEGHRRIGSQTPWKDILSSTRAEQFGLGQRDVLSEHDRRRSALHDFVPTMDGDGSVEG